IRKSPISIYATENQVVTTPGLKEQRMFSDEQSKCFGDSASQWSTIALHNLAFGPHDFSGRSTGKILQWRRREVFWSSPLLTPRDRSKSDAAVSTGDKKHA